MPESIRTVINQSTGLISNNPTGEMYAQDAENQSDLVKAIRGVGHNIMRINHKYYGEFLDHNNPHPFMGITKIREMTMNSTESVVNFCKNLLRSRPNIFKLHILLGEYPTHTRLENQKIRLISSNKPRFHAEVGERIGEVLGDPNLYVTEIIYTINNNDPAHYLAIAEVFGTTKEHYLNDEFFKPEISLEYVKIT